MTQILHATAYDKSIFMVDSTDHVTGKTGLTLTITAGKAGGAFGAITPTVTERGNGWYTLSLTASHTDTLGDLALHITGTGADPTDLTCQIVSRHRSKNLAFPAFEFVMTDAVTHAPLTGLTDANFTKQYSIDGAPFSNLTGTITEVGAGAYQIDLTAGQNNGNNIMLRFAAPGADTTMEKIVT